MNNYIYGKNAVKALLDNPGRIISLLIEETNYEFIKLAQEKNIKYKIVNKKELNNLVTGLHQGVVCEVKDYSLVTLDQIISNNKFNPALIVILDKLEDPHNFGAILRIADATGVNGVIIPKHRSVGINATVAKVSSGALEHVKITEVTNLVQTVEYLKKKGFWIIGLENNELAANYTKISYDMPIALVVGSEGKGISRLLLEKCDLLAKIPMHGYVNSLNASVSCGIMLYEIIKNRKE